MRGRQNVKKGIMILVVCSRYFLKMVVKLDKNKDRPIQIYNDNIYYASLTNGLVLANILVL